MKRAHALFQNSPRRAEEEELGLSGNVLRRDSLVERRADLRSPRRLGSQETQSLFKPQEYKEY